jgi:hypothetical protein
MPRPTMPTAPFFPKTIPFLIVAWRGEAIWHPPSPRKRLSRRSPIA